MPGSINKENLDMSTNNNHTLIKNTNGTMSQYIKEEEDNKPSINWSSWIGTAIGLAGLLTGMISTTIITQQKIAVLEEKVQQLSTIEQKAQEVIVLQQKVEALTNIVNELRIDIKELNKELNKRNAK